MIINGQVINDDLANLQQDVMNLLLGDPALAWTPVYKFKEYQIAAVNDQNVSIWTDRSGQNKVGTAIEVRMPAVRPKYPNVPGPQYELELTVRIMEDVVQNNTGLTCESIGLEVLAWCDGLSLEGYGSQGLTLYPDPRNPALRPVYEYPDRFCYDAVFIAELPRDARARCSQPILTADGQLNVTLSDPTLQNLIYYTLDGSLPVITVPGQPPVIGTQLLATDPKTNSGTFAVPAGTTLRWVAWRPGALPSFVGNAVINPG